MPASPAEPRVLPVPVEVCLDSTDGSDLGRSVRAAVLGGASRIELCRDLDVEGLTPAAADIACAREAFGPRPGLVAMIRPRDGGFAYTPAEVAGMCDAIRTAADAGADGVALGALHPDGHGLDLAALDRLIAAADACRLAVTFHRAIDALPDPARAADTLAALGVRRVLTGGTAWGAPGTVLDGLGRLSDFVAAAAGRFEVVVGGGISAANVGAVLGALPPAAGPLSVHAFTDTRSGGRTCARAVRALVRAACRPPA